MPANTAASFTPDQRSHEIARLLAAGVRRLFSPRPGDIPAPPNAPEKSLSSDMVIALDGDEEIQPQRPENASLPHARTSQGLPLKPCMISTTCPALPRRSRFVQMVRRCRTT